MASLLTWPSFQMLSCQQGFVQWDAIAKLKPQKYRWCFCAHHCAISPLPDSPTSIGIGTVHNKSSGSVLGLAISHSGARWSCLRFFLRHRSPSQHCLRLVTSNTVQTKPKPLSGLPYACILLGSAACGFTVSAQAWILLNINRQEKGHRGIFTLSARQQL